MMRELNHTENDDASYTPKKAGLTFPSKNLNCL
jgi:hypothetical protein